MSLAASDLDSAKYGYDLVCATTQDAINATMKEFLSGFREKAFWAGYTFDSQTRTVVDTPLSQIEAKIGGDPFSIPNGSDQTNPLVQKLYSECKFEFGFKAKMGLPAGIAPTKMPDIIVLDKGSSLVSYQLYCAEFSVIVLNQDFGSLSFSNLTQPAASPWIFLFEINLDMRTGDQNAFNTLPPSVQARIKNLSPNSIFSVQQLYLDLNSAGLQGMPTIEGLDPTSTAAVALNRSFINEYWKNLGASGILLGYSVKTESPNPNASSPSLIPTDLNIEISPYLDSQGNATSQYGLYTLNYLVMSNRSRMPAPVPFGWNWVEQSEIAQFQGTMAVRRDIFANFLKHLIDPYAPGLSIDPTVATHHDGERFHMSESYRQSPDPARWTLVPGGAVAGSDGYAPLLTIGYSHNSYDSSEDSLHLSSINGTFNYSMHGKIEVGGNVIRATLHSLAYMEFHAHGLGIDIAHIEANIVDYQSVVEYTIDVDSSGQLVAHSSKPTITNRQQDPDVSTWDEILDLGGVGDLMKRIRGSLYPNIERSTEGYENMIGRMLNGSGSWVYPGGKTFFFKQVAFSEYQDLVSHVTYVDPR